MKPKQITRTTFLMGVGGAAALAAFGARAMAQAARPNVLWVVDDDHPPYMMGPMPVTRQKIRDVGIEFTLGSRDIPLCGPTRVSLLTGLSVTTHKCDTNRTWPKFVGSPLQLQQRTVARHLKDAGYATGHFGKYVNGHGSTGTVPPHWDRWCEITGEGGDSGGDADKPQPRQRGRYLGGPARGQRVALDMGGREVRGLRAQPPGLPLVRPLLPHDTALPLHTDLALKAPLR